MPVMLYKTPPPPVFRAMKSYVQRIEVKSIARTSKLLMQVGRRVEIVEFSIAMLNGNSFDN